MSQFTSYSLRLVPANGALNFSMNYYESHSQQRCVFISWRFFIILFCCHRHYNGFPTPRRKVLKIVQFNKAKNHKRRGACGMLLLIGREDIVMVALYVFQISLLQQVESGLLKFY